VTVSHPPGGRLPLLSARPAVTFPAAEHYLPLAGTKVYCLVLAISEVDLQELVDRLDRVCRKYRLLISVEKTKVMVIDGISCHIRIQNEQLEQVDTFPYLGSLITEDA